MYQEGPLDQNDPESEPTPSLAGPEDRVLLRCPDSGSDANAIEELKGKMDVLLRTNHMLVDEILAQRADIRNLKDQCNDLRKSVNSLGFRTSQDDHKPSAASTMAARLSVGMQCDDLPTNREHSLRSELLRAQLELNERTMAETRRSRTAVRKDASVQTMERITRDNRIELSDDVIYRTKGGLCVVGKYTVTASSTSDDAPGRSLLPYSYAPSSSSSSYYASTEIPPTEQSIGSYQLYSEGRYDGFECWRTPPGASYSQSGYEALDESSYIYNDDNDQQYHVEMASTVITAENTPVPADSDISQEENNAGLTDGDMNEMERAKDPSSEPTTEPAPSDEERQESLLQIMSRDEEEEVDDGKGVGETLELDGWTTLDFGNQMTELIVIEAVKEYLAHHGLIETLDVFSRESKALKVRESETLAASTEGGSGDEPQPIGSGLLAAFDKEDQTLFFQLWQSSLPPTVRVKKLLLEFRLRVHFFAKACLDRKDHRPVSRVNRSQGDQDWMAFTAFLGRQRRLSNESLEELMPYYVLPYIDAPQTHDLTKHIFTDEWRAGLRKELEETIRSVSPRRRRIPLLYSIAKIQQVDHGFSPSHAARAAEINGQVPSPAYTATHGTRKDEADPEMAADLYRLAEIGIRALQNDPSSEFSHDPRMVMEAHHQLERMRSGSQALLFGTATSVEHARDDPQEDVEATAPALDEMPFSRMPVPQTGQVRLRVRDRRQDEESLGTDRQNQEEDKLAASSVPPVQCPPIDMQQLSHYLHSMRDSSEAMIPALRSIIRHIASPYEPIRKRRSCIYGLIGLGALGDPISTGDSILLDLLCCPDVVVSDLTACTIAIISCEAIGRWFMAAESNVITQLVHNMFQAPSDSPAFMHSLAALQRLSMRYNAQTVMLRENVIENMMTRIENGMLSRFGVRWGLALVVCLCNRQEGIKRLSSDRGFLEVLVSLMSSDDNYICESTYELIGYLLVGAPQDISIAVMQEFEALGIVQAAEDQLDVISRDPQSDHLACQLRDLLSRLKQRGPSPADYLMDRRPEDDATDTACYLSEEDLSPLLIKHWRQLPPNDMIVCHFGIDPSTIQGKAANSKQQARYSSFIKKINSDSLPLIRSTLYKTSPRRQKSDPKRKQAVGSGRRIGQPVVSRPSRLSNMPQHADGGPRSGRRR
ncbi:LisH domain-containing protein armc9 [Perkinsus chesapeaki]|uniref:LisH domain-containing protein ARMC9 n=1 Tax=Perkinsus chesapeaki TaxID=330153 RepID=A0A7J6LIR8_PERCH|nr:LisH domain-containing protein armc9 [Perkinsus chesapeaki]